MKIHYELCVLIAVQTFFCHISKAEDVYKSSGTTVELVCPYKASNGENLRWSYVTSASSIVYSENNFINTGLPTDLKKRLSIIGDHGTGEYHLTISNLTYSDTGTYECSVTINKIYQQRLFVIDAPSSVRFEDVVPKEHLIGTEGQDLTIKCTAVGGNPDPDVTLHIPGLSTVPSGKRSVTYALPTVDRSYDGQSVICKATNNPNIPEQKTDRAEIYLNLKPSLPAFDPDLASTIETAPLVVTCKSNGSRPAGKFQWILEHNNINVTANSTQQTVYNTSADTYTVTSTLTVSIDRTYHRTYVVCGVSNTATTTPITSRKILDIKYAPDITVENTTFLQSQTPRQIKCILDGNPDVFVFDKWQHKSMYGVIIRELEGTDTLTLPSVPIETRYQDTGEYICTAGNGIKDKSGSVKQTGSGYITVNAIPIFSLDNNANQTQFGEFGKTGQILVYVYSIPKYSTVKWYRGNTPLTVPSDKYISSDNDAAVKDTFHGVEVKLDGYEVTLTITELTEKDFDNYTLELYSGSQKVEHMVILESASAPQTPMNFSVAGSSESSIKITWIAGYNGGHEQTFYVEYRIQGSANWIQSEIPIDHNIRQFESLMYTVSELQDGTVYNVKMFAKNKHNRSLPTDTKTVQTKVYPNFAVTGSSESTITVQWNAFDKREYNQTYNIEFRKQGSPYWNSVEIIANKYDLKDLISHTVTGLQDGTVFEIKMHAGKANIGKLYTPVITAQTSFKDSSCGTVVGGVSGGLLAIVVAIVSVSFIVFRRLQSKISSQSVQSEKEYDTIGMEATSDIQGQEKQQRLQNITNTYEAAGVLDKPNIYDELKDKDGERQVSEQQYETLGVKDKPNIYEELQNKQKYKQEVYENQKPLWSGK